MARLLVSCLSSEFEIFVLAREEDMKRCNNGSLILMHHDIVQNSS
jgi:hypothetical protein